MKKNIDEMREAFEKWFRSAIYNHDYDVRKCGTTGNYQEGRTSDMWIAWQAATASAEAKYLPVIVKLVGALHRFNNPGGIIECDREHKNLLIPIEEAQLICKALAEAAPLLKEKQ